jgi:cell wall-associated NlpC family hydrolase
LRRLVAALAACAAAVSVGAATAAANPGPGGSPNANGTDPSLSHRIHQVNAQLDRLSRRSDLLDEQYNLATTAVEAAQNKAKQAQLAANRAEAHYRAAHAEFVRSLTQQYESGFAPSAGGLLTSDSTQQYLDGVTLTDYLASRFAATVKAQKAARADADRATAGAAAALADARTKEAALAVRRSSLQRQAHRFKQLLGTLTARQQRERAEAEAVAAAEARAELAQKHPQAKTANGGHHPASPVTHNPTPPPADGPVSARVQQVIDFAEAQVGKSYSYGGSGPYSYDCSGLTMAAYAQIGVHLPHSAADQYNYGTHVAYSDLQPGDLIFLYSPIGHVELYVGHDLAVSAADPSIGIVYVHPSQDMGSYTGATRIIG